MSTWCDILVRSLRTSMSFNDKVFLLSSCKVDESTILLLAAVFLVTGQYG